MPVLRGLPPIVAQSEDGLAQALLSYGRELERERAAQEGGAFSGRAEADALIENDPNAFLLGVLFTQGIPAERAWAAPLELRRRLGHLDVRRLAAEPRDTERAIARPPALHRFKRTLPRYIAGASRHLLDEYGGDARRLWADAPTAQALIERLEAVPGIGSKKASMTVEILIRRFGVVLRDHQGARLPYDVHVRRVTLRAGLVEVDDPEPMHAAAARISPARPSLLDLPLWLIGRRWCRPRHPRCEDCRLGGACPRLVERSVEGVGARRRPAVHPPAHETSAPRGTALV